MYCSEKELFIYLFKFFKYPFIYIQSVIDDADASVREVCLAAVGDDQAFGREEAGRETQGPLTDLRAVMTSDFMTADAARIPWELLEHITTRIVNEVDHVNRVLYDCTSKLLATIEME